MINLTIVCKDNTKQVNKMVDAVLLDSKGGRMQPEQAAKKVSEIARTIVGANYESHTVEQL